MRDKKNTDGIYCHHNPSVIGKESTSGITIIALVVTIVILLILAGITIASFIGDKGLLNETKNTKNEIGDLQNQTIDDLYQLTNELSSSGGDVLKPDDLAQTVEEIVGKRQEKTITVEDANKNKITVPGGFKIVPNSPDETDASEKVDYTYNGDGLPVVQDGIVIEDVKGNQFVWIPIGEIKNKDNTTNMITLGRYTFDEKSGTPTLIQDADDYATPTNLPSGFGYDYQELVSSDSNAPAKDLSAFVKKTKANGGYYLARYEASKDEENNKARSQANKTAWVDITQPKAAEEAQNMYEGNSFVDSDLINSYTWDTAIIFIQTYSEGNSNYANQEGKNTQKTGTSGDKVCNIYEIASNCFEWTTEYGMLESIKETCGLRGGYHSKKQRFPRGRNCWPMTNSYPDASFRAILYLK